MSAEVVIVQGQMPTWMAVAQIVGLLCIIAHMLWSDRRSK